MIDVIKTFNANFRDYNSHILQWIKLGFTPFLIWLVGFFIMVFAFAATGESVTNMTSFLLQNGVTENIWIFLSAILYFTLFLLAVLGMHINGFRYLALGEGGNTWFTFPFDKRLLKILLYFLLISIFMNIYVGSMILFGDFLFEITNSTYLVIVSLVLLGILGIYLLTRLSLTFLYVSTDQEKPLRTSWHRMHKHVWRFLLLIIMLFGLFIGFSIPIGVVLFMVAYLLSYVSTWLGAIVLDLITPFAILFFFALMMEAVVAANTQIFKKNPRH